jgi:RNA polymerase sigma-70 factor (ECF subfamily)
MSQSALERVALGDPAAMRQCMDEFGALVWSLARRLSRTAEDAEDATQEIFLEIWRSAGRFDAGRGSPKMFIAMIARRRLIDRLRKTAHEPQRVSDEILEAVGGRGDAAERAVDARQAADALDRLRPEHRQVLELCLMHDLSQTEIAERLKMPLGSVKTFMRRGLLKIRELMNEAAP